MPHYRITHEPGERFGRLTILQADPAKGPSREIRWIVRCDCGTIKSIIGATLRAGRTVSCGCLRNEENSVRQRTHGLSASQEYHVWSSMRNRCSNPKDSDYPNYGQRGIYVCPEWESFEQFISDMGRRPSPKHSIDRIDNDGPYSPENCRWATKAEQTMNKQRPVRTVTHNGRTATIADWARETGLSVPTLSGRLKLGWPVEKALTHPFDPSKAHYKRRE